MQIRSISICIESNRIKKQTLRQKDLWGEKFQLNGPNIGAASLNNIQWGGGIFEAPLD